MQTHGFALAFGAQSGILKTWTPQARAKSAKADKDGVTMVDVDAAKEEADAKVDPAAAITRLFGKAAPGSSNAFNVLHPVETFGGCVASVNGSGVLRLHGIREANKGEIMTLDEGGESDFVGVHALSDRSKFLAVGKSGKSVLAAPRTFTNSFEDSLDLSELAFEREDISIVRGNVLSSNILLAGGKEKLGVVFDYETQKEVWKVRNLANDFLDLHVPIWDKDACWLPQNPSLFVMVTMHGEVRLYDIRGPRRPVLNDVRGDKPFMCVDADPLAAAPRIALSNTMGELESLDFRNIKGTLKFERAGAYHGSAGSLRSVSYHPTEPLLASVGLDRYLHVWSTRTRKPVLKTYVKQRLNSVCWFSVTGVKEEEVEEEEADLFGNLAVVDDDSNDDSVEEEEGELEGEEDFEAEESEEEEEVVKKPKERKRSSSKSKKEKTKKRKRSTSASTGEVRKSRSKKLKKSPS